MKRRAIKIMFLSMLIVVMIFSSNKYAATKRTLGDINKDDVVDTKDQLLIMRHRMASARKTHPEWILSGDRYKLADLTQNGRVDNSDMLKILRYIAATRNPSTIGKKHRDWLILGDIDLEPESVIEPEIQEQPQQETQQPEIQIQQPEIIEVTSITLNRNSISLNMSGTKTAQLTATVRPNTATNKEVTWSSDNKNVAEVSQNGRITAKENGTAVITAKTTNGKTATCTVTVTTSPTRISLNKNTVVLYTVIEPKTSTLTATITPSTATNKTITWTSSNNDIATVDRNGRITAKKAGTVTITAKTFNDKTATCKVKVNTIDPLKWEQNERVYTNFIEKNRKQVEKEQHNLLVRRDTKARNFSTTIGYNKLYYRKRPDWRKNTTNNKSKLSYLIKATNTTNVRSTTFASCAGWVHVTFRNAGIGYYTARGACELCEMWCLSSDRSELKPGMIIAVTTHGNRRSTTEPARIYGHVGIYVGNGKVRHFNSWKGKALKYGVRETTLDEWIKTYGDLVTPKWGWMGGIELENDMSDTIKY